MIERSCGETSDFWKSWPFSVPGANASLMLVRWSSKDRGNEARNAIGSGQDGSARNGVLLVWHGGRTAAAMCMRLGTLADLGLHMKGEIARDLVERGGEDAESCGDFGHAITVRMPGSGGEGETQLLGKVLRNREAVGAECCESSDSAAELES